MTSGKRPSGYTIVEVMIVLAVSGLMFLVAANFINGKQAKTSFKTGVIEMSSRLQDVIEQVNDGHYTDKNFTCQNPGHSFIHISTNSSTNGNQGVNSDCVFLGYLLYFEQGTSPSDYQIIPLAGSRLNSSDQPATTLAEVQPTPIIDPSGNQVNLISDQIVPQNLDVLSVGLFRNNMSTPSYKTNAIGFIQGLGSTQPADASGNVIYNNGAQSIAMVYSNSFDHSSPNFTGASPATLALDYTHGAVICLGDGTRFATLTIGGQNNQLTVETKYFNNRPTSICNITTPTPGGPV